MRLLISAEGEHEPKGQHYMVVDNHGLLIDLSGVHGALHDPTIARIEWGPVAGPAGGSQEGGVIVRTDGSERRFADKAALKPYLAAYAARKAEIAPETASSTVGTKA